MLYLQTTQKAREVLGIGRQQLDTAGETTSPLGNWMLNVVPVGERWVLLFMSTRSFLSFPMLLGQHQPTLQEVPSYMTHGLSLLMRGMVTPNDQRDRLLRSFDGIFICKARDKSLLAAHSAVAADYSHRIDRMGGIARADMDKVVSSVNSTPRALLGYMTSFEVSAELLRQQDRAFRLSNRQDWLPDPRMLHSGTSFTKLTRCEVDSSRAPLNLHPGCFTIRWQDLTAFQPAG